MSSQTLAFFGATGGCAGYCLAHTLNAGYNCIALARTPSKLTQAMKDKGVSTQALDQYLTIAQGNAKDVESVKKALQLNGKVVDTVMVGIGGTPILRWSIVSPVTLTDPTICQTAGATLLQALTELNPAKKPLLIDVSTTGIWPKGMPSDLPLVYRPLYPWLLGVPHEDKHVWEQILTEHMQRPETERGLRNFVHIKPSLLFDGDGKGLDAVRQGIDEDPAVGYTIQRGDVGLFIFEKLIKEGVKESWLNKSLTLTY